jgi:hypothetical protein
VAAHPATPAKAKAPATANEVVLRIWVSRPLVGG